MIQRGGEVVIRMLANVQQTTIKPLIEATIAPGSLIYTDEYGIYTALPDWGYEHQPSVMVNESMPVTTMVTVFVRCMSTQWKDSGRSYALGYVLIVGFLRRSYPCT